MQVEVTFRDVPAGPLQVRMSRSSPGRYALHEFAKNVFDVQIKDGYGPTAHALPAQPAPVERARPRRHGGRELPRVRRPHRRHLPQRGCHARAPEHAGGADVGAVASNSGRRASSSCRRRARTWSVATQLFPTASSLRLHGAEPAVPDGQPHRAERVHAADLHGGGRQRAGADLPHRAAPRRQRQPRPTPLPATSRRSCARRCRSSASCRASTAAPTRFSPTTCRGRAATAWSTATARCCRRPGALRSPGQRAGILGTVAHEFFHAWNMERIRSKAIEPFDFDDANMSGELWFGEGFTSYYDALITQRAGLTDARRPARRLRRPRQRRDALARPSHPHRRADVAAGAVRRCRRLDRQDGVAQHLHLVLHVGRRARPGRGSVAARH